MNKVPGQVANLARYRYLLGEAMKITGEALAANHFIKVREDDGINLYCGDLTCPGNGALITHDLDDGFIWDTLVESVIKHIKRYAGD